ncbi:MAG: hypothetical protein IH886_11985 [Nitrospinae bacterium]|nr:hypothetical protein [Nitrospinota bacterium]
MNYFNNQDGGMVSFHGDFGDLQRVDYYRIPADALLSLTRQPSTADELLQEVFEKAQLASFRAGRKNVRVLHQNVCTLEGQVCFFAVVHIPEGSTMYDLVSQRRANSTRAVLLFIRGEWVYSASKQVVSKFDSEPAVPPTQHELDSYLSAVKGFSSMIYFR